MNKIKKIFPINNKPKLQLDNCICNSCECYYDVYEAKTGITNRKGEKNITLNYLCFCSANMIGLPFFNDKTNKFCPEVIKCTTHKKLKKPRTSKKIN